MGGHMSLGVPHIHTHTLWVSKWGVYEYGQQLWSDKLSTSSLSRLLLLSSGQRHQPSCIKAQVNVLFVKQSQRTSLKCLKIIPHLSLPTDQVVLTNLVDFLTPPRHTLLQHLSGSDRHSSCSVLTVSLHTPPPLSRGKLLTVKYTHTHTHTPKHSHTHSPHAPLWLACGQLSS